MGGRAKVSFNTTVTTEFRSRQAYQQIHIKSALVFTRRIKHLGSEMLVMPANLLAGVQKCMTAAI